MGAFSRRQFIASAGVVAACGCAASPRPLSASISANLAADAPWRGERVVDCHFHARSDQAMIAHLDGAGISNGLAAAGEDFSQRMPALAANYPGRIVGWTRGAILGSLGGINAPPPPRPFDYSRDFTAEERRDTIALLNQAKRTGFKGFAETAGAVAIDGPEMHRLFAMASDLDVPIMMHFQQAAYGGRDYGVRGFSRIEPMLRQYPRTTVICHASDFWGHIDANYQDGGTYPTGRVTPGGLAERLLADYSNIYGDFSAPSGFSALSRDLEFTGQFLTRHQNKLIFGSDCGCADGRGGQQRMPPESGVAGKCVARELLNIAWTTTARDVFRKLVWANGARVYKFEA